jgi:hypothetical protein
MKSPVPPFSCQGSGSVQERNFLQFLAALFLGPVRFGVNFSPFQTSRVAARSWRSSTALGGKLAHSV